MTSITLVSALCLPELDVVALGQGRMVSAIVHSFLRPGQSFLLLPSPSTWGSLSVQKSYQAKFIPTINQYIHEKEEVGVDRFTVKLWAECTACAIKQKDDDIKRLSRLTVWSFESLRSSIAEKGHIFLANLRVYELDTKIDLLDKNRTIERLGRSLSLPQPIAVNKNRAVLPNQAFENFSHRLETSQSPPHEELEYLEAALSVSPENDFSKKTLKHEICTLLNWKSVKPQAPLSYEDAWINNISSLGNRSKENNQEKSNYQAGTDFEIAVRNSLEYLGFKIDYAHRGGAGGLDLSCSQPYTLVGECKSGKKIPNDTAVQLLNLGTLRLPDKETFRTATKLIIGPGEPTPQLEKAAIVHGMAIINPTALENLVKLHHKYPGSVDLFQLKDYLADGRADDEVDKYIHKVREQIALRAHIVGQVSHYLADAKAEDANVDSLHAVYVVSKPKYALSRQEFYEILVELSSPLAGYLGRRKGSDGSDRFYFLRELNVD